MKSILEALVNNQLQLYLDDIEETTEFRDLKAQMDECIEKWIKKVGEAKRPYFDKLWAIIFEQQEIQLKDNYLYAFRLGAMATIEVFINKEMMLEPDGEISNKSTYKIPRIWPVKRSILEYLANESINTTNPKRVGTEKYVRLDSEYEMRIEEIVKDLDDSLGESIDLGQDIDDIKAEMYFVKKGSRFSYGYSLGTLIIIELFQDCGKLISIEE